MTKNFRAGNGARQQTAGKVWVPIELLSENGSEATVIQDYSARELAVQPGEEVAIEESRHNWLLVRNVNGERAWILTSHIDK